MDVSETPTRNFQAQRWAHNEPAVICSAVWQGHADVQTPLAGCWCRANRGVRPARACKLFLPAEHDRRRPRNAQLKAGRGFRSMSLVWACALQDPRGHPTPAPAETTHEASGFALQYPGGCGLRSPLSFALPILSAGVEMSPPQSLDGREIRRSSCRVRRSLDRVDSGLSFSGLPWSELII